MKTLKWAGLLVVVNLSSLSLLRAQSPSTAQTAPLAPAGAVEHIKVHGKFLEGNLEGDSPDRDVAVYLPPSYAKNRHRRYPVVYFLHGYDDSSDNWYGPARSWINLPAVLDKAFAEAGNREMIFVTPNAFTRYHGSFYSNSVTTGNWEDYIVHELVPYIDAHYRTIPERAGRGLSGHSMGGYGTIRIGMRHPDVFSSIYLLSACCMNFGDSFLTENGIKAETAKTPEDANALAFLPRLIVAVSAAWSPNPKNPPLFADLPVKDGKLVEEAVAKFHANEPLYMIDQYIGNLRQLQAIGLDAGNQDSPIVLSAQQLHKILTSYGIAHQFGIYEGDHLNHIDDRIERKVVPFFSQNLSFDQHHR
jgi:enterochelin esterase-like enzyme